MLDFTEIQGAAIVDAALAGKKPQHRYFFIAYGPPGSGKDTVANHAAQRLRVDPDTLVQVNVDSIVQQHPEYKRASTENRAKLYFQVRSLGADSISDRLLNTCLAMGYNVVWETTGARIAWTVKEVQRIKRQGYRVVVLYPLVETHQLKARAKARERKTGQTAAAPDQVDKDVSAAARNARKLIPYVDSLLVYDNTHNVGEDRVVMELVNTFAYTPEVHAPGPGWQQHIQCDCKTLAELRASFDQAVLGIFEDCSCSVGSNTRSVTEQF